jgi:hypothetical protein
MSHQDYTATISAKITAKEAIDRISRVPDWWTKGFMGASEKPGDIFTVRFGETFVDFQVIELIPEKRIVWQVTDCNLYFVPNKKEWNHTRVVWEVSSDKGLTTVRMTHVGLVPEHQCYENCERGWNFYVTESLRKLLTENKGLPDGSLTVKLKAAMAELRAASKKAPYTDDEIENMDLDAALAALNMHGR